MVLIGNNDNDTIVDIFAVYHVPGLLPHIDFIFISALTMENR